MVVAPKAGALKSPEFENLGPAKRGHPVKQVRKYHLLTPRSSSVKNSDLGPECLRIVDLRILFSQDTLTYS